ncbi:hypothetical protein F5Y17DRAFT_30796 [Xylariaceae sp. FL0594]|nr:hypothetical protein F5Y17DRAFT_30796 [Xylariaceae sp. FL0594]
MRSMRGLRRAIPSTSPRYLVCFVPHQCRRLTTTSPAWRSRNAAPTSQEHGKQPDLCSSMTAVMAKLPHPAVVITTLDRTYRAQAASRVPIEEMRHPIACGITASSFTSLCIRPKPHVMFNMTLPSTMYEALVSCGDFNVHVLTPDTYGARVASVFTRGNRQSVSGLPEDAPDNDADLGVLAGLKEEGLHQVEITNRDAWHEQYHEAKESGLQSLEMAGGGDLQPTVEVTGTSGSRGQAHEVPCLHYRGIMEVLHCRVASTIRPELPSAGEKVIVIGEVVGVTLPKECDERPDQIPVALGYADRKYRKSSDAIDLR